MMPRYLALLAPMVLIGCGGPAEEPVAPPSASTETLGTVDAEPEARLDGRSVRRMDIDQLAASVERATGGIRWTEQRDGKTVDLFEELAPTLGKPDYLQSTDEDLTPSLLFQKFLDDAAISVCGELMEREAASPASPVFLVSVQPTDTFDSAPDAVEENLRAALLRFHGRKLKAGDPQLEPWTWLFRSATEASGDPLTGWNTVCIGLLTHPDFYSY